MENVDSKIIAEVKETYDKANEIFKNVRSVKEFHDIMNHRSDIYLGAYDGYNNDYNLIDFMFGNCLFTIEIFNDKEPYISTDGIEYWYNEEEEDYIILSI